MNASKYNNANTFLKSCDSFCEVRFSNFKKLLQTKQLPYIK